MGVSGNFEKFIRYFPKFPTHKKTAVLLFHNTAARYGAIFALLTIFRKL